MKLILVFYKSGFTMMEIFADVAIKENVKEKFKTGILNIVNKLAFKTSYAYKVIGYKITDFFGEPLENMVKVESMNSLNLRIPGSIKFTRPLEKFFYNCHLKKLINNTSWIVNNVNMLDVTNEDTIFDEMPKEIPLVFDFTPKKKGLSDELITFLNKQPADLPLKKENVKTFEPVKLTKLDVEREEKEKQEKLENLKIEERKKIDAQVSFIKTSFHSLVQPSSSTQTRKFDGLTGRDLFFTTSWNELYKENEFLQDCVRSRFRYLLRNNLIEEYTMVRFDWNGVKYTDCYLEKTTDSFANLPKKQQKESVKLNKADKANLKKGSTQHNSNEVKHYNGVELNDSGYLQKFEHYKKLLLEKFRIPTRHSKSVKSKKLIDFEFLEKIENIFDAPLHQISKILCVYQFWGPIFRLFLPNI
jgi:hypothetical protein